MVQLTDVPGVLEFHEAVDGLKRQVNFRNFVLAAALFAEKDYTAALETYARAVDAVRYVQHNKQSSNEVRADLLVVMVTCSNNAATCCLQLKQWTEACNYAKNTLVLIDALEEKYGMKIHTILTKVLYNLDLTWKGLNVAFFLTHFLLHLHIGRLLGYQIVW